jgi:hypothetical protein
MSALFAGSGALVHQIKEIFFSLALRASSNTSRKNIFFYFGEPI